MHKKLLLCLLLLCSFIFIASAIEPPSYEVQQPASDPADVLLAAEPLLDDDDENTLIEDDEEDEEATSSLNHIDEDDAKDSVEEIDIWANAGDNDDDEEDEESEEDLVDDEDEEDDEHDHDDDEEEEEDEDDDEEGSIDHDSFDDQDEDLYEQDRVQFGLDPDTTQTEEEEELKWSNQFIPEEDRSPDQSPPPQQPIYEDEKKEVEQGHAETEAKAEEASLMDLGVEDADNDIPPPEHGSHQDSEPEKQPTPVQDWNREPTKKPCHKWSTLVWLGLLACCIVLFYGARIRANSIALDGDSKHAILPLHQNDIKSPLVLSTSPLSDPSIVIDAHSKHLHPPSGRGHHRKASSLSAHITPRSRPTSAGHDSPWTGEWKEGKEW
ncbi:hypothetical protein BC943DRAFT_328039 [Umbelopsis sp. AD052]|nr:hypothetical protein BC943DRAFT_328039 [Umbelopsis sp. AD052]